jgi:hypothetical protein
MKEEIFKKLCDIYNKYVKHGKPTTDSQLCLIWPVFDPPDVLETTQQHIDIENSFDITIEEKDAVEMFDMTLKEASIFIEYLLKKK